MLRKTIFILALPLSLTLPSWGADGLLAPASLYIGAAEVNAPKQDEAQGGVAASLAEGRNAGASGAENVDCFYQQYADYPDCLKRSKAQAPDETHGLHQKAGY